MFTIKDILSDYPGLKEVKSELNKSEAVISLSGCSGSFKCHLAATLKEGCKHALFVTHNDMRVKEIAADYALFDKNVCVYPAKDMMFYQADIRSNELSRQRMKCIRRILENKPVTIITTFDALMARQTPLAVYESSVLKISKKSVAEPKAVAHKLVNMGYEKVFQVEGPGQFSIRGDIIDIFELTEENPYRIELWGDDVESIRAFDVLSQRSIEELSSIEIYPASEMILSSTELERGIAKIGEDAKKQIDLFKEEFKTEEAHRIEIDFRRLKEEAVEFRASVNLDSYINYFYDNADSLLSFFENDKTVIFFDEPLRCEEHSGAVEYEFRENMLRRLEKGYVLPKQANVIFNFEETVSHLSSFRICYLEELKLQCRLKNEILKPSLEKDFIISPVQSYNGSFEALVKDLSKYRKDNYKVILLSASRTRARRLSMDLTEQEISAFYTEDGGRLLKEREIETYYGYIARGYAIPSLKFAVISETDIFGSQRKNKKRKKLYEGLKIQDFNDLTIGDYVVHEFHGLGIYRGIEKIEVEGVTKDYIKVEYRDGGNLYVLATGLSVLQKYASQDARTPKLNKLGSQEWVKTKEKVRAATREVAEDLIKLYAARQSMAGYSYGEDTVWQKEFEEMFPYDETQDQLLAIEATKKDMESPQIMDRLVCGDVGFGKTEIAIRAAFKAVQEGKQVVYLVPTTILAQQHYDTFCQRMKDFPVRVDLLSRFRTQGEIKRSLTDLRKGFVDIVIGTHRVLSKDVEFKDLGLLIIDEEQRFGVTHKEKIKQMKESVDVLTLTATPIPRTLHMSLIGIRDMSILEEAPNDRQPIQTYVLEYNEEMVREAIVRELSRNGQVYYVYNRVNNIDQIASEISKLVPEARIAYAHGQMAEKELEYIMYQFINHEIDVLVSTTIIETGMDISNVNTMIIHDSDKLGLSQLYQLRGRVGRSNRTAYAFLMYKRDKLLKEEAEKRLSAIKEFTDLGSGYKIAMKDLEIRGAGNLLGRTQHGHMQAVGYDLYCKMLNEAVRSMKGEKVEEDFDTIVDLSVDAYISGEYIVNEVQKLDIYKRIAGLENEAECQEMREELIDRFGQIPISCENLLRISMIRVMAHDLFMTSVKSKDNELIFSVKRDAVLNPDGVVELFKTHEKLSFSNKNYQFVMPYKTTGLAEKDERKLLELAEMLLKDMGTMLRQQ